MSSIETQVNTEHQSKAAFLALDIFDLNYVLSFRSKNSPKTTCGAGAKTKGLLSCCATDTTTRTSSQPAVF